MIWKLIKAIFAKNPTPGTGHTVRMPDGRVVFREGARDG